MNVIEKFIEKYKKCIILLSGFEKLHLEEYAKLLAENFNFELIKFNYPDFESLNNKVSKSTNNGIVIYGLTFPSDELKFKTNYHISLSANRSLIDNDEKYNIYQENNKKNYVNKFKNFKDLDYHDDVYLDIFNLVIDMIEKKVYQERYEEIQKIKANNIINSDGSESQGESKGKSEGDPQSSSESEHQPKSGGKKKFKRVIGTRLLMKAIQI